MAPVFDWIFYSFVDVFVGRKAVSSLDLSVFVVGISLRLKFLGVNTLGIKGLFGSDILMVILVGLLLHSQLDRPFMKEWKIKYFSLKL